MRFKSAVVVQGIRAKKPDQSCQILAVAGVIKATTSEEKMFCQPTCTLNTYLVALELRSYSRRHGGVAQKFILKKGSMKMGGMYCTLS